MRVLMVAEKPSIADTLAKALSPGGIFETERRKVPVHYYNGPFKGQPAQFTVTSVAGHVFTTDFPSQFNNRDTTDPLVLFSAPTVRVREHAARSRCIPPAPCFADLRMTAVAQLETSSKMVRHIQEVARGTDHLVLWLDCDREVREQTGGVC